MITYTWSIDSMKTHSQLADQTNVISSVAWRLTGSNGTDSFHINGEVALPRYVPNTNSFIPYDQLTEEQVISWTKNAIGKMSVENYEKIIADRLTLTTKDLPWASPVSANTVQVQTV